MPNREINARIASIRKLREFKQSEVAEFLNLKTSTYSQMERNGIISDEMIVKLAEIFNVHPMLILCGEDYERTPEVIINNNNFRNKIQVAERQFPFWKLPFFLLYFNRLA